MPYRRGRKSAAQTPAPRSERIKGSKKNPKGTAASQSSAAKIVLSDKTIKALSKKAKEYNKTHKSSVSLNTLKAVYRRGLGAYSSSHRPTITGGVPNTRNAWAMARVNKFLMKKAGKKVKAAYVQDDDLLARGGNVFDDKALLKRYKQGKSIGFSAEAHLKAKGLLPRADGTKRKSEKYKKTYAKRIAKTYSKGGSVLYHGSPYKFEKFTLEKMGEGEGAQRFGYGVYVTDLKDIANHYSLMPNKESLIVGAEKSYKDGGLIAPNGKRSNLTPEQYKLVRTPEFKAWFGDWENDPKNASKVVDENGEPLVVYHGTSASFNTFKEEEKGRRGGLNEKFWSFTTNIEQAKIYALDNRVYGSFSTPRIIPAFLNIREMPSYDNQGKFYRELEVWGGYKHIDIFQLQDWHSRGFNMGVEFKEVDGFEVKNTIEMEERADLDKKLLIGNTYYVRNSNQIKLADGTNTTFDSTNSDIRFAKGGKIDKGQENFGQPPVPYSKILLIHEAPEENAIQIKKEGFRKPQNEKITKGVYTIPLAWKNKKFDDRPVSQELVITLKEGSKIFWSNSPRPTDFYIGYGNKFYENLFNELNKGYTSPRKSYTDENRSSYLRRFEKWLKNNGYVGVQQGGEIVITDYSAIDSIKSFTRKAEGGFDDEVIICSNCLWSWKLSETTPEEKYICHKCGHDNTPTMDKITMDVPLFIRLLEFAREDAKDDMELHTLTENALKLGDKTLTMEDYQQIVFSKTTSPKITKSTNSVVEFPTIEQEFSDGGVVVGKRHSESDENGTGEKFLVESTGQIVELEGGEGVLCKESMQSKKIYKFEGKEMTGREIASFLNHKYGGVEFAKGGQVDEKSVCGCRSMYYHGGELPSATLDSLKGGEAVVTVKTMESKDKFAFQGRQMTPRKILSHINQESGGKKFEDGGVIDLTEHHLKNLTKMVRMINFTEKIFYF